MCLNGLFYHYINPSTAAWMAANLPHSAASVFGGGVLMTVASLLICIPVVSILTKWVPQLIGKPKWKGPILSNLI